MTLYSHGSQSLGVRPASGTDAAPLVVAHLVLIVSARAAVCVRDAPAEGNDDG